MRRHEILKRFAGLIAVFMLAAGITAVSALAVASNAGNSPRGGALHVTKECSQYNGQAGSFCTITSSNIKAIKPGMRVVYLQPLGDGVLDSDVVLSFGRRPAAFGHVVLDLATAQGRVTFSGYDPLRYHAGRGPLEALGAGLAFARKQRHQAARALETGLVDELEVGPLPDVLGRQEPCGLEGFGP